MIQNINDEFDMPVKFDTIHEMEQAIKKSGLELPEYGLIEGRDYIEVRRFYCNGDDGSAIVEAETALQAAEIYGIPTEDQIDDGGWLVVRDEETHESLVYGDSP